MSEPFFGFLSALITPLDARSAPALASTHWGGSLASLEFAGRVVGAFFLFAFGACVGSFLNVVVYRLPAGLSVVTPPSRCPFCGGRLGWRENLPVFGWLLLRGRCRHCAARISLQYPLIEALVGLLFAGVYLLYYASPPGSWLASIGGPFWPAQGFAYSWPAYIALVFLFAGLLAMTLIDARTFTIPFEITVTVATIGLLAAVVQPLLPVMWKARGLWPVPLPGWEGIGIGIGGLVGALVTWGLLTAGRLPVSFSDWDEHVKPGDSPRAYPHARREIVKELRCLVPIGVGILIGWIIGRAMHQQAPPLVLQSVGAAALGFVVGGGLLWGLRIAGTLVFGREAMGMGDVHLLAAVGTVLGWGDTVWILFLSPAIAISWLLVALVAGRFMRGRMWDLPFGPHLAGATVVLVFGRPAIASFLTRILGWEPEIVVRLLTGGSG